MAYYEGLDGLDKKYYKIGDVAEILKVPASTIRYWESEFEQLSSRRSKSGRRFYSPEDIRTLRMIHFLIKVKGLRIEAAKEELRSSRSNVSHRLKVIEILTDTRTELEEMLSALTKRR